MAIHAWIWPNRAADAVNGDILERSAPATKHHWTGDRAECWSLEICGIHPDFQGKGHGRLLVQWGFDKADAEGVCNSVVSAWGKDGFYKKCGFDLHDGNISTGKDNPMADLKIEGGNIHWRLVTARPPVPMNSQQRTIDTPIH
jgi:GNAT superfamily N-acetyltransferase